MNIWASGLAIAMLLAGCLPPRDERIIFPDQINEDVMPIKGWDMGCDNLGLCTAIGALPPRKVQLDGIRGALRITFRRDEAVELTIIPLDFEQRLPDVKPTPAQSATLLDELRLGGAFMLWHKDGDGSRYYLPGTNFPVLEALYREWLKEYPVRLVQQEPIMPVKGTALQNYRSPILTKVQLAECDGPDKGRIEAAWDVGGHFLLFQYNCSPEGRFHADKLWFTLEKQSGRFAAVGIDEAVRLKTDGKAAGLYNSYFEPSQGLLVTRKSAESSDCGLLAVYAATPSGFQLAERRQARHCIGLFGGDWIRTYRDPAVILPVSW